uniref:Protein kinase domain-containing protein n=1 Tax=Haptolina brevifila TaxID=156173 RepID=A0A7S2GB66_9EUKA
MRDMPSATSLSAASTRAVSLSAALPSAEPRSSAPLSSDLPTPSAASSSALPSSSAPTPAARQARSCLDEIVSVASSAGEAFGSAAVDIVVGQGGAVELVGCYRLHEVLGRGSYAVVHRAHNLEAARNGFPEEVAVKLIDVAKVEAHASLPTVDAEVQLMKSLHHPYIVTLYEELVLAERGQRVLVQEYMAGGELFARLVAHGAFPEEEAAILMAELFSALAYLHERGIAHRDVKPENICFEEVASESTLMSSIRLIDFGFAAVVLAEEDAASEWMGSPQYVAPEQLAGQTRGGTPSDLWACGVVLYSMLCGFPPWTASVGAGLEEQIAKGAYQFFSPWWDAITDDAKALVRGLLTIDPKRRLTALQAEQHVWVRSCGGALPLEEGEAPDTAPGALPT